MMLDELSAALSATECSADRTAYERAIVEANCLAKPTAATRRSSLQRLSELYALDPGVALFRVLRKLWDFDSSARPLVAMLCAVARDPLFAASAGAVVSQAPGAELRRVPIREALRSVVGQRMNDDTVDKVVRNVASSWTQTGHLCGRTLKFRQRVDASPTAVAFALWLAHAVGFRGDDLFSSGWMAVLDCTPTLARTLALEAKRQGLLDLRAAGDVLEFGFERLDLAFGKP